jgi:hypothetical protein
LQNQQQQLMVKHKGRRCSLNSNQRKERVTRQVSWFSCSKPLEPVRDAFSAQQVCEPLGVLAKLSHNAGGVQRHILVNVGMVVKQRNKHWCTISRELAELLVGFSKGDIGRVAGAEASVKRSENCPECSHTGGGVATSELALDVGGESTNQGGSNSIVMEIVIGGMRGRRNLVARR